MTQKEWIYKNNPDNSARYILGTKGQRTLFCFGINPSTATPEKPDPTIRKVARIAEHNGYDSFIMVNVYPKRDTVFEKLEDSVNDAEHLKNIAVITEAMADHAQIDIWLAFGDHIYDRAYLPICLKDIYARLPKERIRWFATGVNKSGAPKHPLYQKNTASFIAFDMLSYMKSL